MTTDPILKAEHASPVALPLLKNLVEQSVKRTHEVFLANFGVDAPPDPPSQRLKLASKILDEWSDVKELPKAVLAQAAQTTGSARPSFTAGAGLRPAAGRDVSDVNVQELVDTVLLDQMQRKETIQSGEGILALRKQASLPPRSYPNDASSALVRIKEPRKVPKPQWHAPWKLMR
ncbi:pre-mRNA-splicing factor prp46, partial [Thoreauomyces humboldtii]